MIAVVRDVGDTPCVGTDEVAQPAPVVLGLKRQPVVLDTRVEAHHLIADLVDADACAEEIGREEVAAVRQPDLAVFNGLRPRLALPVLDAVRVVHAEPCRDLLVVVVIAKGPVKAELACRWEPLH